MILVTICSKYWAPGIYVLNVLVQAHINIKMNEGNSMSMPPAENIKLSQSRSVAHRHPDIILFRNQ